MWSCLAPRRWAGFGGGGQRLTAGGEVGQSCLARRRAALTADAFRPAYLPAFPPPIPSYPRSHSQPSRCWPWPSTAAWLPTQLATLVCGPGQAVPSGARCRHPATLQREICSALILTKSRSCLPWSACTVGALLLCALHALWCCCAALLCVHYSARPSCFARLTPSGKRMPAT